MAISVGCAHVELASDAEEKTSKSFRAPSGKANLYIVRNDFGLATLFPVILDGYDYGMLASGTYFLIPVDPGRHVVVSSTSESQQSVEFGVEAGQNYFVSIKSRPGLQAMRPKVSQLSEEDGRLAVNEARLARRIPR